MALTTLSDANKYIRLHAKAKRVNTEGSIRDWTKSTSVSLGQHTTKYQAQSTFMASRDFIAIMLVVLEQLLGPIR